MSISRSGSAQAARCTNIGSSRQASKRTCAVCHPRTLVRNVSHKTRSDRYALEDGPHDPFNAVIARLDDSPGPSGSLSGWSAAIKANICVKDARTSCASQTLLNFKPTFDATAVSLVRLAGAKLAYQTNCDEFGMGSANVHSVYGPVRNPASADAATVTTWSAEQDRAAGGSSGGAAAAVRAGLARFALGSDTGGSVRLPAAYCGVVGLKPSYGLISRWGLISYADSLDTVGVLARTVNDASTVFDVLSAPDSRDPTCASQETRTRAKACLTDHLNRIGVSSSSKASPLAGVRIGIPREYFPEELHLRVLASVRESVSALEAAGAEVVGISLPTTQSALSAYYIISSAEASSNLARYDGVKYGFHAPSTDKTHHAYAATRSAGFGEEVRKRILLGTYALTADAFDNYFLEASRVRKAIQQDFQSALRIPNALRADKHAPEAAENGVDVILHPSAVNTAPTLADSLRSTESSDSLAEYVQDILTVPASLAGLPALSVPAGVAEDDKWPVGVTAVTQWGCEKMLFEIGRALESHLKYN